MSHLLQSCSGQHPIDSKNGGSLMSCGSQFFSFHIGGILNYQPTILLHVTGGLLENKALFFGGCLFGGLLKTAVFSQSQTSEGSFCMRVMYVLSNPFQIPS